MRLSASRLSEHTRCSAGTQLGVLVCKSAVNFGGFVWPGFSTFAISNFLNGQ